MAPFKQPKTLRGASVIRVARLFSASCLRIHSYSEPDRIPEAVESLRQHLITHIAPLGDEICAYILAKNRRTDRLGPAGETLLKVFSQSRTKTLRYLDAGDLKTEFWNTCIPSAPNVLELDLSSLIYIQRHMLLTIGDHLMRLNEIFLPFVCVTSEDFCLLEMIKSLRVIENKCVQESTTNMSHKFGYGYKRVPIMRLLLALPDLEYIDCNCMGAILADMSHEHFPSLRYCRESEPTPQVIKAVAETCPNLERLVLGNVLHSDLVFDLAPLAESSLGVSALTLYNYSFDSSMEEFLRVKGTFLRSLELNKIPEISADQIRIIGKSCRYLRKLVLYLRGSPGVRRENPKDASAMYEVGEPILENLREFSLSADERLGKSYAGLLTCLAHTTKIQTIVFKEGASANSRVDSGLDSYLSDLADRNPMTELESIVVRGRSLKLSIEIIKRLHDLPNIKTLTLKINHERETVMYLEEVRFVDYCNNLNIRVNY